MNLRAAAVNKFVDSRISIEIERIRLRSQVAAVEIRQNSITLHHFGFLVTIMTLDILSWSLWLIYYALQSKMTLSAIQIIALIAIFFVQKKVLFEFYIVSYISLKYRVEDRMSFLIARNFEQETNGWVLMNFFRYLYVWPLFVFAPPVSIWLIPSFGWK